MRVDGPGDATVVDRWDGGLSWMAHPEETFRRTSHALAADGDCWLVDPLDGKGLDETLAGLGSVAGVTVLSSYHLRDAAEIASRHGVTVHLPASFDDVGHRVDPPVEWITDELGDTGFRVLDAGNPFWEDVALYHPGRRTLVTGDALTTADYHTTADRELQVTPYLAPWPPRKQLSGLAVDRVIVGHGRGVFTDADRALSTALSESRWAGIARAARRLPTLLRAAAVALR